MPIYTYTTLDDPLATDTFGIGINNTGLIVGGYSDSHSKLHGFLLSGGTFTPSMIPRPQH